MKIVLRKIHLCAVAVGIGFQPCASRGDDWWIEAGPVYRGGMRMKITGQSYAQQLGLHAAPAPLALPPSVGQANVLGDRVYDDGYVKLDSGTLNPNSVGGAGNTWNWGYNQASQYNAQAGTLTFHKQGDIGYQTSAGSSSTQKDLDGAGFQLSGGFKIYESGRWSVGLGLGLQGLWGVESKMSVRVFSDAAGRYAVEDKRNVADATDRDLGFPGPVEYKGTYDGPAGSTSTWPGGFPVIGNLPDGRTTSMENLSTSINTVNYRVKTDFYELTLNPRIGYQASESVLLHLTPKLGVAFLDVSAKRAETFVDSAQGSRGNWSDSSSSAKWRLTTGLSIGADVDLGSGYYAGLNGGYEWTVADVSFNLGPNNVSFSGSGYVFGLTFGKRF